MKYKTSCPICQAFNKNLTKERLNLRNSVDKVIFIL